MQNIHLKKKIKHKKATKKTVNIFKECRIKGKLFVDVTGSITKRKERKIVNKLKPPNRVNKNENES